jgi:penicillin-binding protein 1B
VWIGFDDNRDIGLTGGQSAAPIWGEFMKRAVQLPAYRNTQEFDPPAGVIQEIIDPETSQLATPQCPKTVTEYFVAGSEPRQFCQVHGGAEAAQSTFGSWLSHLFGHRDNPPAPPGAASPNGQPNPANPPTSTGVPGQAGQPQANPGSQPGLPGQAQPEPEKKKGVLEKIFGIFGGSKKPPDKPKDQQQP